MLHALPAIKPPSPLPLLRVLWLVLLAVWSVGHAVASSDLVGRVVRVADGDTVTVLDSTNQQHRIRLKGIDAPESSQAFGNASRKALADMLSGGFVRVRVDSSDRYGRAVGVVFLGGRDVNLAMIQLGMAWHYKAFELQQTPGERAAYDQAEQQARQARIGLWRDANPTPPWAFRRKE